MAMLDILIKRADPRAARRHFGSIEARVGVAHLHETDYSPWEGHAVIGWPQATMLRGKIVVEQGQFFAEGACGSRKISETVRARPVFRAFCTIAKLDMEDGKDATS